jgi:UDP-N-acetylmuramoyl-tripeptide--D-alanyl-D-alanine ligase
MNFSLQAIAKITCGTQRGEALINGVSIDTRSLQYGDLFVAIPGAVFDGHDFVADAAARGASAALVERFVTHSLPQILVRSCELALADIARARLAQLHCTVVGITGSNGKTSVKTLTHAILSAVGKTVANPGNRNNEIGLPLAVCELPDDVQCAVLEMGAGKPGDIDYLVRIAKPHVALVNNVGPAHLERLGDLRGVAHTKGAIYRSLGATGTAVINVDDDFAEQFMRDAGESKVVRYSVSRSDVEVYASQISFGATTTFVLHTPAGTANAEISWPGMHNVSNALAAASIGVCLQAQPAQIVAALATVNQVSGRLVEHQAINGATVVDDSYNANPASMQAAIDAQKTRAEPVWLVIGDMFELGAQAKELHAQIGAHALKQGVAKLLAVGENAQFAAAAFGAGARHYADQLELIKDLRSTLVPGVRVIVKGSRSAHMERVVAAISVQPTTEQKPSC